MAKKLSKNDGKWLFGIGITWMAGLWALWSSDLSDQNVIYHIKFIYSMFLTLAIAVSAHYIVFKMESKNDKKR